jgi:hypothetical protein
MVGVVGSSPIEPTNELQESSKKKCGKSDSTPYGTEGHHGYDTANYYRWQATVVEVRLRPGWIGFDKEKRGLGRVFFRLSPASTLISCRLSGAAEQGSKE